MAYRTITIKLANGKTITKRVDERGVVPNGGTANQVLAKTSDDDFAVDWVDQSGVGSPELTVDELAAINGAASPSASNVFATMADIPDDELTADQAAAIDGAASPSASNVFATMADLPETGDLTMTNGADNRIVTATGAAGLNGEDKLLWDGTYLRIRRQTQDTIPDLGTDDGGIFKVLRDGFQSPDTDAFGLYVGVINSGAVWLQSMANYAADPTAYPISLQPKGGDIGIGTATPVGKLELYGNGAKLFIHDTDGPDTKPSLWFGSSNSASGVGKYAGIMANYLTDTLEFWHYSSSAGTSVERAAININGQFLFNSGAETTPSMSFLNDADTGFFSQAANNIGVSIAGDEKFRFSSAGDFYSLNGSVLAKDLWATELLGGRVYTSAGTEALPSLTFDGDANTGFFRGAADTIGVSVGGDEKFRFTSNGSFHVGGDGIFSSTTTPSDRRMKAGIKPLRKALDKIMRLAGVTFHMKKDPSKAKRIGLIAQDVQLICPEVVKEVEMLDGKKRLTIDYQSLVPVLIEAVKDQQAQINEMKAEIKKLKQ